MDNLIGESLNAGEIRPATLPITIKLMNACMDDALPRLRGYISNTAKVSTGNTNATPKAVIIIGMIASGRLGSSTIRL